jgi:hypothetical protein
MESTDGYIFGLFVSENFISENAARPDSHAFAFSLHNPHTDYPEKLCQKIPGKSAAFLDYGNHGPSLSCLSKLSQLIISLLTIINSRE